MEVFGIVGMTFGSIAFVWALNNTARLSRIEKKLAEAGILDD